MLKKIDIGQLKKEEFEEWKLMYKDDLLDIIVDSQDHVYILPENRNGGLGKKVFEWIFNYAISKGCETFELNSYVNNYPSHKFYMNLGYDIKGYHFVKHL